MFVEADHAQRALVSGWGRTVPTAATVRRPRSVAETAAILGSAGPRGVIARGLGRAYGDAAQNAGGTVIDCTGLAGMRLDPETGVVTAAAGMSVDALLRALIPHGWFVPVSPGTRQVTVGGAIAADIHGKNHHRDGSFSEALSSLRLILPSGEHRLVDRSDGRLFQATVGGMGLTGVIVEATFRCIPIRTSRMRVDTVRAANLEEALALMAEGDDAYRYSVAWIDLLARGPALGRSVLTRGDHAEPAELTPRDAADPLGFDPRVRLGVPPWAPPGLLNPMTVRAFNELWFRRAPRERRGEIQPLAGFFHPLDALAEWNRLYGRRGFLQYQFLLPFGAEGTLQEIVERVSASGVASFLAVLKRLGAASGGWMSFPAPGWTLTLDVPVRPRVLGLTRDLDTTVLAAGGRVYLAKDSVLRADAVERMYPRVMDFRALRSEIDPQRILRSDLARRLEL